MNYTQQQNINKKQQKLLSKFFHTYVVLANRPFLVYLTKKRF